ncbi:hypothetical protein SASPL_101119 [Salvia splendens]|uniref:DUF4408 domain-containing protein n=1 Tax=Salvia splendens TaxID=180675 RepID=A0A8X8YQC9_SALSN|nr:uncharacterized protein LOC121794562 [Salvia splendens]KAG6436234.1 hypothetical protein SASPL_101119 [Salvia splendens]
MDSIKFENVKVEKANAISSYRSVKRITTLFRVVELLLFAIVVSRFSTALPLKLSGEYFRTISVALISPRFVFLLGNAIVVILFFKSGQFSAQEGEGIADFYEEFVEKCRKNEEKKVFDDCKVISTKMCKSSSEKLAVHGGRKLSRSKTVDCRTRQKMAAAEEMSSEEFRRTVEAFIARQQRFLREED